MAKPKQRIIIAARKGRRVARDLFTDITAGPVKFLSTPAALVVFAVAVILSATHTVDKASGFFNTMHRDHPDVFIWKFLSENIDKAFGTLILSSAMPIIPKRSSPVIFLVGALIGIYALPPANFYQYSAMMVIMVVFACATIQTTRTIAVVSAFVYFVMLHKHLANLSHISAFIGNLTDATKAATVKREALQDMEMSGSGHFDQEQ